MNAHRRWGSVLGVYATRVVSAYVLAAPLAAEAAATGIGHFERGDARLFEPGGMLLLDVLLQIGDGLRTQLKSQLLLLPVLWLVAVLAQAALLVALAEPGILERQRWFARVSSVLPRLALLGGIELALKGALVLVFGGVTLTLFGNSNGNFLFLIPAALGVLCVLMVGLLMDLVRAAHVRDEGTVVEAVRAALSSARQNTGRALGVYAALTLASTSVVLAAAFVVGRIPLEHGGTLAALSVAGAHQLAILMQTALRAEWLASALRLVPRQGGANAESEDYFGISASR